MIATSNDQAVVCDLGTGYMKMGYSGDNFPKRSFASIVGRPMLRSEEIIDDVALKVI
jgi:actin-related protein 2